MRARLTLAVVGVLAGALLLAGAGSLLVNRSATRHDTQVQLKAEAENFAKAAPSLRAPRAIELAARVLRVDNARVILVTAQGTTNATMPSGLAPADLDLAALARGQELSGWIGTTAYVAEPLDLAPRVAARLRPNLTVALVVTRSVGVLGSGWLYFLLASGIALLVGAGVAAELSRRLARPVAQASEVAQRIAGGQLSARMPTDPGEVPELSSLAVSINAMAAGLEEARHRESRLLLSVSHDLRTPLTSIRGYAEAIADGITEEPASAAGVIVTAARRLERLVADLLDLAKLDSDHLSLHLAPTDVVRVVTETVDGFGRSAADRGVTLDLAGPLPEQVTATADPDRLAQVVANLVENAVDFARSSVVVTVRSGPGWTEISVEDDGAGIPPADLTRVFDRFYQVDQGPAARRGSGLGLSIVNELVRAMGGQARAESPVGPAGGGTRMVVTLRTWGG